MLHKQNILPPIGAILSFFKTRWVIDENQRSVNLTLLKINYMILATHF